MIIKKNCRKFTANNCSDINAPALHCRDTRFINRVYDNKRVLCF